MFTYLKQKYDLPEVFYLDLWPLGPTFVVLSSPESAAHAIQLRSYGMHEIREKFLRPMLGSQSLVVLNGQLWKNVHQMLLPAFKPQAVRDLLGRVCDETETFCDMLGVAADNGGIIRFEGFLSTLLLRVISLAVMGACPESQAIEDLKTPVIEVTKQQQAWNPISRWRHGLKARRAIGAHRRLDAKADNRDLQARQGREEKGSRFTDGSNRD